MQQLCAKSCNNFVQCPAWNIELAHVSPPYLHILLGVVKKRHLLLEQACHDLDERIDKEVGKEIMIQNTTLTPFEKYCQNWREIQILKKEREKLKRELRGCGLRTFQACQSMRTLASSHFSQDLSQAVLMMH